jgi:hypothetical protein
MRNMERYIYFLLIEACKGFNQKKYPPTIGVLLCTDTDNTIARYSVLHDNEQLYATKYMTYMPTEEELRNEIEQQKRFFIEQYRDENQQ